MEVPQKKKKGSQATGKTVAADAGPGIKMYFVNRKIIKRIMSLDEQIKRTEDEFNHYRENKFSAPEIVSWLESVLDSLYRLKDLEK